MQVHVWDYKIYCKMFEPFYKLEIFSQKIFVLMRKFHVLRIFAFKYDKEILLSSSKYQPESEKRASVACLNIISVIHSIFSLCDFSV